MEPVDLAALTLDAFTPLVGDAFAIAEPARLTLELSEASGAGEWPGGRQPFRLLFRGPPDPVLPQAIYRLEHARLGALEIFVVPVGRDDDGTSYEAIFT
ncbi:MAG: hypothetical protein QOJ35_1955 [Solirubrobacteraceae bacterium]|nr:hypothetical protein [Solirubrobacteraceae bacterium]